jgi:hypothetical protein
VLFEIRVQGGDCMRRVAFALGGLIAGGGLAFVVGVTLPEVMAISQAEGAYMMGVMFFWVPVAALTGLIVGAVLGRKRH